jgi:broad specificity phosphatase PhoE
VVEILLIRHGETDWKRENRFQGHADPPLNALGLEQAAELATALAAEELAAVYSSPLQRALVTAQVVAEPHRLVPVPLEALREVDVGSWEALTRDEIEQRYPEQFKRWLAYEQGWDDGETYEQMGERVLAALEQIAARHDGDRILAVTHGGPIRAALARAEGITHVEARRRGPVVGNCFVARFSSNGVELRRVG